MNCLVCNKPYGGRVITKCKCGRNIVKANRYCSICRRKRKVVLTAPRKLKMPSEIKDYKWGN